MVRRKAEKFFVSCPSCVSKDYREFFTIDLSLAEICKLCHYKSLGVKLCACGRPGTRRSGGQCFVCRPPTSLVNRLCEECGVSFRGKTLYCSTFCRTSVKYKDRPGSISEIECKKCSNYRFPYLYNAAGLKSKVCRGCVTVKVADPAKARADRLKRYYNLTVEEFDAIVAYQGNVCWICKKPAKRLAVDHDHISGVVRSAACNSCNRFLVEDLTADYLRRCADYLDGDQSAKYVIGTRLVPEKYLKGK